MRTLLIVLAALALAGIAAPAFADGPEPATTVAFSRPGHGSIATVCGRLGRSGVLPGSIEDCIQETRDMNALRPPEAGFDVTVLTDEDIIQVPRCSARMNEDDAPAPPNPGSQGRGHAAASGAVHPSGPPPYGLLIAALLLIVIGLEAYNIFKPKPQNAEAPKKDGTTSGPGGGGSG